MASLIVDVLRIKQIQREINRELDSDEIEIIRRGEPVFVKIARGSYQPFFVPLIKFPHDLMSKSIDIRAIEESENSSFWDFLDDEGK